MTRILCSFLPLMVLPALLAAPPAFKSQTIDDAIQIGYGLAIGDVNGDGKADILLADKSDVVWYQNPSWQKHIIANKLTLKDNVCIAAKDLDGDGKVEIAVGANWSPGNTISRVESGSIHYLIAPEDRTQRWQPVRLPGDPTTHRMHWVTPKNAPAQLVVLPLHGIGNKGGEGDNGVRVFSYEFPIDSIDHSGSWRMRLLDESLHKTHNFDVAGHELVVGGTEGLKILDPYHPLSGEHWIGDEGKALSSGGIGEVRWGPYPNNHGSEHHRTFVTIEPIHGNAVVVYGPDKVRTVLDESLAQGHALACGQFLRNSIREQVIAGWRNPDKSKKVGIRMYVWENDAWTSHLIDDNTIACEDLKVADLDGDGRLDIIAAGRATQNVVIFWNEN